jgi:hypothetical protein
MVKRASGGVVLGMVVRVKERHGSVDRRGVDGQVGAVRAERAGTTQGGAEGKRAGRR